MESRDHHDHNFKTSSSPRADSFVDTTDDAMTVSTDPTEVDVTMRDDGDEEPEADAIIKCICGYGAGYDDDDCTSCMMCETWQHNLCYFVVLGRPVPKEDDHFFCIDCAASLDVDPALARDAMRRKLRKLELIGDRMSELQCEIAQREEEMQDLQDQLACVESEWYTHGVALAAQGLLPDSSDGEVGEIWEDWAKEHFLIAQDRARTLEERDAILARIGELEADAERTRLNEPTQRELNARAEKAYYEKLKGTPAFWTTASSLGTRSCYYWSKPPCLLGRPDPVLTAAKVESTEKVVKPKKKRRRIGR